MIKSDLQKRNLLIFCLLLLSIYSVQIQAQENESDVTNQQESMSESDSEDESTDEEKPSDSQEPITFNVDVLVDRMKETKAIGVITKLSLKNQVDDLLEQANEIKSSSDENGPEEKLQLREKFEGLILKTVTLLNKGEDYTLAEDLYLARDELWKSIMENKA